MLTLSMQAHVNVALTQVDYKHASHRHTTPPHHGPRKPPICMFTVCIQRVFMCLLLVFAAYMMASFMHGACVCATTCMWHACIRDAIVQCMSMHVGGMHACSVWHAYVCGVHSCGIYIGMPEGCIVLVPYLLQICTII
jgi:hypothetical protein